MLYSHAIIDVTMVLHYFAADKQKATHIFVLMNPHSFAQEDFGLIVSERLREVSYFIYEAVSFHLAE